MTRLLKAQEEDFSERESLGITENSLYKLIIDVFISLLDVRAIDVYTAEEIEIRRIIKNWIQDEKI